MTTKKQLLASLAVWLKRTYKKLQSLIFSLFDYIHHTIFLNHNGSNINLKFSKHQNLEGSPYYVLQNHHIAMQVYHP